MPARTDTKYESDLGTIHRILLTPDFAAAAGAAPAGDITSNIRPKVSKSNGEFGLRPRGVRVSRTLGTDPDTFKKYAFLPVLSATVFAGTTFNSGAEVTIGGITYTVVSRVSEDY